MLSFNNLVCSTKRFHRVKLQRKEYSTYFIPKNEILLIVHVDLHYTKVLLNFLFFNFKNKICVNAI